MEILSIVKSAVLKGASDLHLAPARPPMLRLQGKMVPLEGMPALTPAQSKQMIYEILLDDQKIKFEKNLELDCAYAIPDFARFRVNVHMQKDGVAAVMRVIQSKLPNPEDIALEPSIIRLVDQPRGLVLVTGPTGSGKTTTLACMLDLINRNRHEHILTIEDPIEFVHPNRNCVVTQRELLSHTHSFGAALRSALREDPDVILVGEMRDQETIALALTASETGHLVFSTLHTTDAAQTVDRIVDVFPPHQQQQIRTQLGGSLRAVISQTLMPLKGRPGRVAAREIMIVTPAIGTMIREGKTEQMYSVIDTGTNMGMISMERSLAELVKAGKIERDEAISKANKPATLVAYLEQAAATKRK